MCIYIYTHKYVYIYVCIYIYIYVIKFIYSVAADMDNISSESGFIKIERSYIV